MGKEKDNVAWEMLLESLDNQQKEIVRLQEKEIQLLRIIMELESQRRGLTKLLSEKTFKEEEVETKEE